MNLFLHLLIPFWSASELEQISFVPHLRIGCFAVWRMLLGMLAALLPGACKAQQKSPSLQVVNLRCLNRKDPINVDQRTVFLSWQLLAEGRNVKQSAYEIVVADNKENLQAEKASLWHSGKISSSTSVQVPYNGQPLQALQSCYWKLRVWDNKGRRSAWSKPASWQMALLTGDDWKGARWIAYDTLAGDRKIIPAIHRLGDTTKWSEGKNVLPLLRREVRVKKTVKQARLFLCGLGQFELRINGKKIGEHFLDPGWTRYDRHAQYVTFDVTTHLKRGINALGVQLGNGFYYIPPERYRKLTGAFGYPKLICRLVIQYKDGTEETTVSDANWKAAPGPVTFSSIYGGEDFDANRKQAGWDLPGFRDGKWPSVVLTSGPAILDAQQQEPLKIFDHFDVKNITRPKPGVWVYDMGQNASAIPAVVVQGTKNAVIKLTPAELLNPDGTVNQSESGMPTFCQYTISGEKTESWQTQFSYFGFRYIQVEGAVPQGEANPQHLPQIIRLQSLHVRNSAPAAGTFTCSNELFNRTKTLIDWAVKSNMVSVLTDCPHREKLGWLEQDHLMGPSVFYNYDIATLNQKIARDMAQSQTANGMVPNIAPEYVHFSPDFRDSPEWGSASIIMPWYSYQWYGDTKILADNYEMMKAYIAYLQSRATDNILKHGLGDWFDIGPAKPGRSQLTPKGFTATATYYYDLVLLEKIAAVLGKTSDETMYAELAKGVRTSFNAAFFNPQMKQYGSGSQTANAMAVYMGLVNPEDKEAVVNHLVTEIRQRRNALTAGDIGYRYVLRVLEEAGRSDVIFDMNSRSDVPGYGWQLTHGATALTESWQAYGFVSNNHFMLGHLMEWLYSGLAGIRLADGGVAFNKIDIHPSVVGDVQFAEAIHQSMYGRIRSSWKKAGETISLEVEIPVNTEATIYVPAKDVESVKEGGKNIHALTGIEFLGFTNNYALYRVGSGAYRFTANFSSNHSKAIQ